MTESPESHRSEAMQATPGLFPIRVAAIDVGSNAIRYAAVEFTDPARYTEIAGERIAVRLGRDVFTRERRLSPTTLDAGTAALVQIRRRLDDLGISRYRAVATSAVRESRNGGEFVARVRAESGIHLETISGSEEARLVWGAVRQHVSMGDDRWLLTDLGGGSVEVSIVDRDGIHWSESHNLGSVRLLQAFREDGVEDDREIRGLMSQYVQGLRVPRAVRRFKPVGMIATGGNIEALAKLAGVESDEAGIRVLPVKALHEILDQLAELTEEERIERLGLRADRADVIVPAAVVYERIAEFAGVERIVVPGVGVREGVLHDLIAEVLDERAHMDRRERGTFAAALALGRRFRFDEAHGRQVAELSRQLFDGLSELHGLPSRVRPLLLVGALLHDIGQFISYRRHHKHAWYILSHSDLPGLSPEELEMAALVARYHRRAEPAEKHPGYGDLDEEARQVVRTLAAILRVADALDREHLARVEGLEARIEVETIVLELRIRGELALEGWALRKKGKLFEKVFGRALELEAGAP